MASVRVNIDIDDILWEMGTSEKEDLCRELIDDGYGPEGSLPTENIDPDEEMYREAVVKLLGRYSQLTAAQIELVKQLAG